MDTSYKAKNIEPIVHDSREAKYKVKPKKSIHRSIKVYTDMRVCAQFVHLVRLSLIDVPGKPDLL